VVVSTPILNMLQEQGYGAFFQGLISGEWVHFVGYTFVDDTDIINKPLNMDTTYQQVAKNLQAAIHHWWGGINASGGGGKCTQKNAQVYGFL
jgi:hypothetical protein